jgi:hypothetical protein
MGAQPAGYGPADKNSLGRNPQHIVRVPRLQIHWQCTYQIQSYYYNRVQCGAEPNAPVETHDTDV